MIIARKVPQLVDVRDESTTDVRIVLEMKQGTDAEPMRSLIKMCRDAETRPGVLAATVFGGFALADIPDAGTTAIAGILILKFAALTVLVEHTFLWSIALAPVLGRGLMLLMFVTTPCVRAEGLASAVTTYLQRDLVRLILAVCLLFAVIVSLNGLLLMLAGFLFVRRLEMKRLGGCTMDTAGASVEFGEMFWLVGVALRV